jgi:hypothetical protein
MGLGASNGDDEQVVLLETSFQLLAVHVLHVDAFGGFHKPTFGRDLPIIRTH